MSEKDVNNFIMVVDDDEIIRITTTYILQQLGHSVLEASNGELAIERLSDNIDKVVLVLLDLYMPTMNGREVFIKLREIAPHLKIVVASGFVDQGEKAELLKMGFDDFLEKPFTRSDLKIIVDKNLPSTN